MGNNHPPFLKVSTSTILLLEVSPVSREDSALVREQNYSSYRGPGLLFCTFCVGKDDFPFAGMVVLLYDAIGTFCQLKSAYMCYPEIRSTTRLLVVS